MQREVKPMKDKATNNDATGTNGRYGEPPGSGDSGVAKQASGTRGSEAADAGSDLAAGAGIRVLCVDDHAMLIEGLKAQFALHDEDSKRGLGGPIRCVGSLSSATGLLDAVARLNPDIVLLDIEMPGADTFEMADRLRHMHPRVRVVFLSAHIRDGYIAAAFQCGAVGYFSKSDDLEAIVSGLREIARGGSAGGAATFVVGPKVKERCHLIIPAKGAAARSAAAASAGAANSADGGPPATPLSSLSGREMEVLRLIGKGLSRNQIATELSRSVKTIDGHQERMMNKLGISARSDLMRFAIREGLAEV
jgi:DNA-binding NarL/FixJ family response regulator